MASDNFNRANENPIAAPWGAWSTLATCRLVSNAVQTSSGDGDSGLRYTTSTELSSQWRYVSGTQDGGPAVCCQAGSNSGYFLTNFDTTVIYMFRLDAGSFVQIGTVAGVYVANDILRIRRVGGNVVGSKNGVDILTVADTNYLTGNPGAFFFAGDLIMDDWTDGAVATVNDNYIPPLGPGMPMVSRLFFLPPRAAFNLADTSLAAALSAQSTLSADLTAIGKTGRVLTAGPGISPDYYQLFRPRLFTAGNPVADTSLAAALAAQSSISAQLTTAIPLAAALTCQSSVTAAMTTAIPLAAALAAQSALAAALTTAIRPAATLAAVSTLSAGLTTAIPLAAALAAQSALTAALGTGSALAASLQSVSSLSAQLSTAIRLASTLQAQSTLTASLDGAAAALVASLQSVSTLTAALSTAIRPAAPLAAQSTLTAALTTAIRPAATLQAVSTLTATLTSSGQQLSAALASVSTVAANLSTAIRLAAALQSTSTLTGDLTGGAAALQAALVSLSTLTATLTSSVRVQPSGPALFDEIEGQFVRRTVPYVSMIAPRAGALVAAESYGVAIARFAWADDAGLVRTIRTGDQRLGWVRQVFGPRRSIYASQGLRWIRTGLPVSLYVQGEFWARFNGGALAGDVVYVSLLDGSPISGYAPDALPTPWRVASSAFPGDLAIITTWEI